MIAFFSSFGVSINYASIDDHIEYLGIVNWTYLPVSSCYRLISVLFMCITFWCIGADFTACPTACPTVPTADTAPQSQPWTESTEEVHSKKHSGK